MTITRVKDLQINPKSRKDAATFKQIHFLFSEKYPHPYNILYSRNYVYFIQVENVDGFIKIGWSNQPNLRISGIATSIPYKLKFRAIIHGNKTSEGLIHQKFQHLHVRGEWFRPEPELLAYIDSFVRSGENMIGAFQLAGSFDYKSWLLTVPEVAEFPYNRLWDIGSKTLIRAGVAITARDDEFYG